MAKKFYVTTPIYYVNDVPHVGTSYTTIAADALARWHRLLGEDVRFLTGLDENSVKTLKASGKKTKKDIQEYTDEMAEKWLAVWKKLNISNDGFIRTTSSEHKKVVLDFFKKVFAKGDIYKRKYAGLYCNGCEAFYTEKDLVDGNCPLHKKPCEKLEEENYFFRLSKYSDKILNHIKKNPDFIMPKSKQNEVIEFIKAGLEDVSVSRPDYGWGIELPIDKKQVFWVWFDALINYISGAKHGAKNYWPADLHLIGKDILRFHAIIWPAMLISAGEKLPKTVFAHGFFTINGDKISKSLGNAINPVAIAEKYSVDSLRYFILRHIPFGEDGDFSEKALVERHNGELANKFGNLVSRVTALAEKNGLQKCANNLLRKLKLKEIEKFIKRYEIDKALNEIFAFIDVCNEYVQSKKPWETGDKKVLYELVDSIKATTILLWPFIPETCGRVAKELGIKIAYKEIEKPIGVKKIKKIASLFAKI